MGEEVAETTKPVTSENEMGKNGPRDDMMALVMASL